MDELHKLIEIKLQELWPFSSKTTKIKKEYQKYLDSTFQEWKDKCLKMSDREKGMVCFLTEVSKSLNGFMSVANRFAAKCEGDKKCRESIKEFALVKHKQLKEIYAKFLLLYRANKR